MIQFSVFTSVSRLTKHFFLEGGELKKLGGGAMTTGIVETVAVADLRELSARLDALTEKQAVSWGVCRFPRARIVTRKKLEDTSTPEKDDGLSLIARDREHFHFPAPAILMLDYDPLPSNTTPLTPDQLRGRIIDACPGLATAPMLVRASAGGHLFRDDGECLVGPRGLRLLIPVVDGADIPRAGEVLTRRLWLTGHGRIDVSRSGALLERTDVDASVWQPERLDFCAGASTGPGLVQKRPEGSLYNV